MFKHNEAFSFQVATEDQAETDRYWNAIVGNGGAGEPVRLVQRQMGPVNWQITPIALTQSASDPDPAVAKRVFEAMMTHEKDRHRGHRSCETWVTFSSRAGAIEPDATAVGGIGYDQITVTYNYPGRDLVAVYNFVRALYDAR